MHLKNVKLILAREIRDQLRDRRTLFMIAVLPILLYPLLGMSFLQMQQFLQEHPVRVQIVGAEHLPALPKLIDHGQFAAWLFDAPADQRLLEMHVEPPDRSQAAAGDDWSVAARGLVESGQYDAVLRFPPDFGQRLGRFQKALSNHSAGTRSAEIPKPDILVDKAKDKSRVARQRLREVIERWIDAVGRSNLQASGVPANAARPVDVAIIDLSEEHGGSESLQWSKILPVVLLLWALTGAFYPAIDLCAGEKERGTLETLLSSPAMRSEIVLGKLLTVMVFSMITAVLNLLSMGFTGWLVINQAGAAGPPLSAVAWLLICLVPISILFSALCLALAAFARSTKEGQYYLMPLLLITMPLVILPMAPGAELSLGYSLIPVSNVVLLLRAALEGKTMAVLQYVPLILAVTLAATLLAIRWAIEQFNSETVLFRESERLDVGLWLRHLVKDRRPTPSAAAALFCGVLILVIKFFLNFAVPQTEGFAGFALVTVAVEVGVILGPAVLMAGLLAGSPRQTLLLRWPRWTALPAAALLAMCLHPAVKVLEAGVMRIYPVAAPIQKELERLETLWNQVPVWQLLLLIAVLPAICEELAFRGFVLSGLREMGHKWRAIACTAVFFGLTHALLQQSLIAALVGLVIGYLAVQSGSILPGMVFHVVNNSLAVLLTRYGAGLMKSLARHAEGWPAIGPMSARLQDPDALGSWPVVLVSGLAALMLLWWFHRLTDDTFEEQRLPVIPVEAVRANG